MSKYNAGDKFIIQIGFNEEMPFGSRYYIKGFRTLVFDDKGLDRLERYDTDKEAVDDYNEGYEDGAKEAWRCARKIVVPNLIDGLPKSKLDELFGSHDVVQILEVYSASKAISILNEYEYEQNEIKIGDEVTSVGEEGKGVVIGVTEANYLVWKADDTGGDFHQACWYGKSRVSKTGSHYYIQSILDKLRDER